jgi:hypothetical protein
VESAHGNDVVSKAGDSLHVRRRGQFHLLVVQDTGHLFQTELPVSRDDKQVVAVHRISDSHGFHELGFGQV